MRRVMRADDLPKLAERAETQAEAIVDGSAGAWRWSTNSSGASPLICSPSISAYPSRPKGGSTYGPPGCSSSSSPAHRRTDDLRKQVEEIAPAFRAHIDREIGRRRWKETGSDDVLGRCLALQAAGEPGFSDVQIRTALLCMIVGGPPQPPMVVPQAMEQLLRRPDALAAACDAARADEDE